MQFSCHGHNSFAFRSYAFLHTSPAKITLVLHRNIVLWYLRRAGYACANNLTPCSVSLPLVRPAPLAEGTTQCPTQSPHH